MTFIFSVWYIVALVLLLGVVASIVVFVLMNKKDKELINQFVKSSGETAPVEETVKEAEVKEETNTENN